jgi:Protein of unknown function (DUF1761)
VSVSVNYLAVIVAAVVAFLLGAIWNGPLFGKAWAAARGPAPAEGAKPTASAMAVVAVALLLAAWVVAVISGYLHLGTWLQGLKLGVAVWVGFAVPTSLIEHVMSPGRKVAALYISTGSWLVSLAVMGIVAALWH